jgi:anti-anti-sigma factor
MQVTTSRIGVATYLVPDAPLVGENLEALSRAVAAARAAHARDLVLDLSQVTFVDSRGLEYIVELASEMRAADGTLRLASPNALCREILAITAVDQTVPVFDGADQLGRSFL